MASTGRLTLTMTALEASWLYTVLNNAPEHFRGGKTQILIDRIGEIPASALDASGINSGRWQSRMRSLPASTARVTDSASP